MLGRLVHWVSLVISVLIVLGFVFFAIDEADRGSKSQVRRLESSQQVAPTERGERARERRNGDVRELIDDANDVLLKPFAGIVDSNNAWVEHGVPALLALIAYGFVLRLLVGYLPGGARRQR